MFHWWWCCKQVFFPRLWHMRICGHNYHSFSTWTHLHVPLLFGHFCWPCFNGGDAANRCFSSTVAYENMQSWLSLFFHLFILIWPALEVGPRHMIINTFNQLRHLAYGVTAHYIYIVFLLFLVKWGTLVYAMMTCFFMPTIQPHVPHFIAKWKNKLPSRLNAFLQLCYTMLLSCNKPCYWYLVT